MADEDTTQTPAPAPAPKKDPVFGDNVAAKKADDERRTKDKTVDWGKYPNKVR